MLCDDRNRQEARRLEEDFFDWFETADAEELESGALDGFLEELEQADPLPGGFDPRKSLARFQKKYRALLRAREKKPSVWRKLARRAAVVLLIVSAAFGGILAVNPEARAAVIQWWTTTWTQDRMVLEYTGPRLAGELPRYEITELPEGYAEVEDERYETPSHIMIVYKQEETGKQLYLEYVYMQEGNQSNYNTEIMEILPVTVQGFEGFLHLLVEDGKSEPLSVTWFDTSNHMSFSVLALSGDLDADELLNLAESVALLDEDTDAYQTPGPGR